MKEIKNSWCHHTIDFWMGCTPVRDECEGCYARETMESQKQNFGILRLTQNPWLEAELINARAHARGRYEMVLTCSTSDFFHEQADPWREEAWDVMRRCRNLIWLILTKRPERFHDFRPEGWDEGRGYPHVWLGTTCGAPKSYDRVDRLREIPCTLRFLSCEPLTQDISTIDLKDINWVVCGGMFGKPSKTNKMELQWAASLYETAKNANVPFFFKQVSHNKPDQGINALELYLSDQSENLADPESADCFRRYPKVVGLPMIPPTIEGSRLSQAELEKYMKPSIVRNVKQKNEPAVHEPESASTAQQQAE